VTGLEPEAVCADLTTFVEGRRLEDDANLLIRYRGGAHGLLFASQISLGEENRLTLRVYGSEAGILWEQEDPESLTVLHLDRPEECYRRGNDYLTPAASDATRLPRGHPEGYIEAFANIYRNAARAIAARIGGSEPPPSDLDFPTVRDGARGVHFVHRGVESGRTGGWVNAVYDPPGG
jgi:predicted dehydrogenase